MYDFFFLVTLIAEQYRRLKLKLGFIEEQTKLTEDKAQKYTYIIEATGGGGVGGVKERDPSRLWWNANTHLKKSQPLPLNYVQCCKHRLPQYKKSYQNQSVKYGEKIKMKVGSEFLTARVLLLHSTKNGKFVFFI